MRKKQRESVELRKLTASGLRCPRRHPNWHGVRCEREVSDGRVTDHIVHVAEGRNFEWLDDRTAY